MSQKRLGIGFIGGGFITRFHIKSLIAVRDVDVIGVMSRTKSSAEESAALARTVGVGAQAKAYDTITQMVADPNIDALWVCSPNFARVETFEEIANAISTGKGELIGVTCEKPLGRNVAEAEKILEDAISVQENGAFAVVLEGIPPELAEKITCTLDIPTIGIGAGPHCDGQIQVYHDILGLYGDFSPKHAKRYGDFGVAIQHKLAEYKNEVEEKTFPTKKHFINSNIHLEKTH